MKYLRDKTDIISALGHIIQINWFLFLKQKNSIVDAFWHKLLEIIATITIAIFLIPHDSDII